MIWECSLRGQVARAGFEAVMNDLAQWIRYQPTDVAFETTLTADRA
jgi:hypothetical protein